MRPRLLVVDDNIDTVELLRRNLEWLGYTVQTATRVDEALALLQHQPVDLVITDWKIPGLTGMDLVYRIREKDAQTGIMMVTGFATIESAVEAMKAGVDEYLPKPFTDDDFTARVQAAIAKTAARQNLNQVRHSNSVTQGIVGSSACMQLVRDSIAKASRSTATVLITGESGTGKELVARAIHYQSRRQAAPFVAINCAAIPRELMESELFGYTRGAFTGAINDRPGFFEAADGGTLFMDEIADMDMFVQSKLLRVIQDRQICRLGSQRYRKIDVRYLAATNKNLLQLVDKGLFREDLYYRLNIVQIEIPPLRDRTGDVPLLLHHYATRFAREMGRAMPRFSDAVISALNMHDWPGNVRELENLAQRLMVMVDRDTVELSDLPPTMRPRLKTEVAGNLCSLHQAELAHIVFVFNAVGGNVSRAARILEIDRKTLREKIRQIKDSGSNLLGGEKFPTS